MDPNLSWTVKGASTRRRLRIVLPVILLTLGSVFFVDDDEAVIILVIFVPLLIGLTIYAVAARDRSYVLRPDGFLVQPAGRAARFHAWSTFASYQTHAEASSRRGRALALQASAELGETFILHSKSSWRAGVSLPTTPETTHAVRTALDRVVRHEPGVRLNMLTILLVIACLALAFGVAIVVSR